MEAFKMQVDLNLCNKNIDKVEELAAMLFECAAITAADYTRMLTATACVRARVKAENEVRRVVGEILHGR